MPTDWASQCGLWKHGWLACICPPWEAARRPTCQALCRDRRSHLVTRHSVEQWPVHQHMLASSAVTVLTHELLLLSRIRLFAGCLRWVPQGAGDESPREHRGGDPLQPGPVPPGSEQLPGQEHWRWDCPQLLWRTWNLSDTYWYEINSRITCKWSRAARCQDSRPTACMLS